MWLISSHLWPVSYGNPPSDVRGEFDQYFGDLNFRVTVGQVGVVMQVSIDS